MPVLVSATPILLLVFLMTVAKKSARISALAGFAAAVAAGMLFFKAGPVAMLLECAKGIWNALTIFYVITTALLLYEILSRTGMLTRLTGFIRQSIGDELLRVLLVGWSFTSFLQSVTGFGIPVAVAAPILASLGFSPVKAVIIGIVGHAWGGTFGTLAIGWTSLLVQAGVTDPALTKEIAVKACILLWVFITVCGAVIACLVRGRVPSARDLFFVLAVSAAQGAGQLLMAPVNDIIACFTGAVLSIAVILLLDKAVSGHAAGKKRTEEATAGKHSNGSFFDAAAMFFFLTGLVAVLLFIPPVKAFLESFKVALWLPPPQGGALTAYSPVSFFTHSGTLLLLTVLLGMCYYNRRGMLPFSMLRPLFGAALKKALYSVAPVVLLIMMSKVMDGSGQIRTLAQATAGAIGRLYPVAAPFIGVLGGFVSSSTMSSNILLGGFQKSVAGALNISTSTVLAAQTAGGSIGLLMATGNIVMGLTTTGELGKEGRVLRFMLPLALVCALLCGTVAMVFF